MVGVVYSKYSLLLVLHSKSSVPEADFHLCVVVLSLG